MMALREFVSFCQQTPIEVSKPYKYLSGHAIRLHETYKEALRILPNGGSVLSVGSWRAHVECALAGKHGIDVTVFDFPEMLVSEQYEAFGFKVEAGDFLSDAIDSVPGRYDLVLFCEIVEHIPLDPVEQFRKLKRFLKPGGKLLVTTPNVASASRCLQLLRGKNINQPAALLFSPVSAENSAVHRREYVMSEMVEAMRKAGLAVICQRYIRQGRGRLRPGSILYHSFIRAFPRWRPMMLLVGEAR